MTVHFNVHMDPSKGDASTNDVADILTTEVLSTTNSTSDEPTDTNSILGDIVIDVQSINIQGEQKFSSLSIILYDIVIINNCLVYTKIPPQSDVQNSVLPSYNHYRPTLHDKNILIK